MLANRILNMSLSCAIAEELHLKPSNDPPLVVIPSCGMINQLFEFRTVSVLLSIYLALTITL